jgi:hypothetical protein
MACNPLKHKFVIVYNNINSLLVYLLKKKSRNVSINGFHIEIGNVIVVLYNAQRQIKDNVHKPAFRSKTIVRNLQTRHVIFPFRCSEISFTD